MPLLTDSAEILERYLLIRDLRPLTEHYYRRAWRMFSIWCMRNGIELFDSQSISQFLSHKQKTGRSCYYRASLRNALRAILRFSGDNSPIRQVKLEPLKPSTWTPAEVGKLIAVCQEMPPFARDYWQSIIAAAWHSGLSQIDLHRLRDGDFGPDGSAEVARSKTGRTTFIRIPPEVLSQAKKNARSDGRLWPLLTSAEWFRRTFAKIAAKAGLIGSFKKLRKSSGTWAEITSPGHGHEHLANSRAIFESHYLDRARIGRRAIDLPPLA